MNLKSYSDERLWESTSESVRGEKTAITRVLHHLAEVERRRLFAEFKFTSMFDYVTRGLKYAEGEALIRISAMRVLKDLPEIEKKISDGSYSLTNLHLVQRVFSKEQKAGRSMNKAEKMRLLEKFENISTRDAQKVAATVRPEMAKKELQFSDIKNESLRKKLLLLRGKFAHACPNQSLEELLLKLCDDALAELPTEDISPDAQGVVSDTVRPTDEHRMSIAAAKRAVWARDQSKCVNCGSTYAVQVDHIIPQAAGGPSTIQNMRLLCRHCNIRAAIKFYGRKKMSEHLKN